MNDYSAVSAYQQSTARGASPVGLVVSLYDTILRDFRRALAALDSNNVELRVFELNHALTVIAHVAPEYEPTAIRTALRLVAGRVTSPGSLK